MNLQNHNCHSELIGIFIPAKLFLFVALIQPDNLKKWDNEDFLANNSFTGSNISFGNAFHADS
jgi:hypothetical protein